MTNADSLNRQAANLHAFIDRYVPAGRLTGALPDVSKDYVKLQEEVMWGGVWQVPGLDVTLRSIATIAAQCCNGWGFGLQHQIRVGLSLGMSPQKVKGIFLQLIFYAGIPATVFALSQAQRVINEQKIWQDEDAKPLEADWLESVQAKLPSDSAKPLGIRCGSGPGKPAVPRTGAGNCRSGRRLQLRRSLGQGRPYTQRTDSLHSGCSHVPWALETTGGTHRVRTRPHELVPGVALRKKLWSRPLSSPRSDSHG